MDQHSVAKRFRGFLPVVIDVETGGFDSEKHALLEIAAVLLEINGDGRWHRTKTIANHIKPFPGAALDPSSLEFTGIDPFHPFRLAINEKEALSKIFSAVSDAVTRAGCTRAILVGHNPSFDLAFVKAAASRAKLKRSPFHSFSTFDTASLAGLVYGQTVLARAARAAGLSWDPDAAHSAIYDAEQTAELFCAMVNRYDEFAAQLDDEIQI